MYFGASTWRQSNFYLAKPKKKKKKKKNHFRTVSREKEMLIGSIKMFVKILVSSNFCFLGCDTAVT